MRVDQAPEGGKFRAVASASIDATAGAWGDGDMLCVDLDASGELILSTLLDCVGVIWTPEGRRATDAGTSEKLVIGGKKYTVFFQCELVEAEIGASPALSAGDQVFAVAAGDVDVTATPGIGAVWIGHVMLGGNRIFINVNLKPPGLA